MSVLVIDAGNSIIKEKIARRERGEIALTYMVSDSFVINALIVLEAESFALGVSHKLCRTTFQAVEKVLALVGISWEIKF